MAVLADLAESFHLRVSFGPVNKGFFQSAIAGWPRQALVNAFADFDGVAFTPHQARHVRQMPQMHFRSVRGIFFALTPAGLPQKPW